MCARGGGGTTRQHLHHQHERTSVSHPITLVHNLCVTSQTQLPFVPMCWKVSGQRGGLGASSVPSPGGFVGGESLGKGPQCVVLPAMGTRCIPQTLTLHGRLAAVKMIGWPAKLNPVAWLFPPRRNGSPPPMGF